MNNSEEQKNTAQLGNKIIQVNDLYKDYYLNGNIINVLKGVDVDFYESEKVAITGKSGAGKSTFMHVLGTLDRPTKGEVLFEDYDVFEKNDKQLATYRNNTIGFVFQFHYLLPDFTALENVEIPMKLAKMQPSVIKERAEELLERVELGDRLHHKPGELSGGEQQRVAIARALVMNPKILLADEPTGNLDSQTSEGIHDLLDNLNKVYNTTLIVVTHNLGLAERMDRTLTMVNGTIS